MNWRFYEPQKPDERTIRDENDHLLLSAWVAYFVMRWRCVYGEVFHLLAEEPDCLITKSGHVRILVGEESTTFSPSTSDASALATLQKLFNDFDITRRNNYFYRVTIFGPSHEAVADHQTLCMAVCKAMLLAATPVWIPPASRRLREHIATDEFGQRY